MLQGINLKKRGKERERGKKRMTWGDQASVSKARNFIFTESFLYLKLYIENNGRCRVM